jgi:DNA-damage-inducible protein D
VHAALAQLMHRGMSLQTLLGYTGWWNFLKVIEKGRESCKTSNHAILDHFVEINKMVSPMSGSEREIEERIIFTP